MYQFIAHSVHTLSIIQNRMYKIFSTFVLTLVHFQNFALLYSRVGAGAAGAASKFLPGAEAA
jgi:hypothetical protein